MATRLDTWIHVSGTKPQPHDTVTEELGFTPTVCVAFRFDKFTDMSAQKDDMVRLVSDLLDRVPGDAAALRLRLTTCSWGTNAAAGFVRRGRVGKHTRGATGLG